jgi:hypothetical protein
MTLPTGAALNRSLAPSYAADREIEDMWAVTSRRKEKARKLQRIFDWTEYHRGMAARARENGEAVALYHDYEAKKLEGLIQGINTGVNSVA